MSLSGNIEPNDLTRWANYEFLPSPIIGIHGCDESIGEAILHGEKTHLELSRNDYDWLGSGVYFWERNPKRALQFAQERSAGGRNSRGIISKPFVLGAILNMKRCLDLADSIAIAQLKSAHSELVEFSRIRDVPLPSNSQNLRRRELDCAVTNMVHQIREDNNCPDTTPCAAYSGKALLFMKARASASSTTFKSACAM